MWATKRPWSRTNREIGGDPRDGCHVHKPRRLWGFGRSIAAAGVGLALCGCSYFLTLPSVGDARARVEEIVWSHHGEVSGPELPIKLADAVVAVEDEHYYSNVILNVLYGVARAAFAAVRENGDPGGSAIAQQLAKQLYPHRSGLGGTLEEIGLGFKLSIVSSKVQILNMYLNAVYYGNHYWGDVAAARGYFGVSPNQLSWAEASLLAGLLQGPSLYNPIRHFEIAKRRQLHVIDQLVDNHYLSNAQGKVVSRAPLPLKVG